MTEHETTPEAQESAEELDVEGPNESAPGHHPTEDEKDATPPEPERG